MRWWLVHLGLLLLPVLAVAQGADRVINQTLPLPAGGLVSMDVFRGYIVVNAGPDGDNQVHVKVLVHADSKHQDAAQAAVDSVEFTMQEAKGGVAMVARNPGTQRMVFSWDQPPILDIRYQVTVPPHCNLQIKDDFGDITVDVLQGDMWVRAKEGTVFFRGVTGSIDARTEVGNIVVSRCFGPMNLQSQRGDIRVGTAQGKTVLKTVNGDIDVQSVWDQIDAEITAGDATVCFGAVKEASSIRTSIGNITAKISAKTACTVRADTLWGGIKDKLGLKVLTGGNGRWRLAGTCRGGGPYIDLDSRGGYITIEAGEPPFAPQE